MSDSQFTRLSIKPQVEHEKLNLTKQCFEAFDDNHDGKVTPSQFKEILRALNRPYTEKELDNLVSGKDSFDYYDVANHANKLNPSGKLVKDAFIGLSQGSSLVSADVFRLWLTSMGEKLSDEVVDDFLRICEIQSSGFFSIDDFLAKLAELYSEVHDESLLSR